MVVTAKVNSFPVEILDILNVGYVKVRRLDTPHLEIEYFPAEVLTDIQDESIPEDLPILPVEDMHEHSTREDEIHQAQHDDWMDEQNMYDQLRHGG